VVTAENVPTTRERILAATREVLGRTGARRLSLSDLAATAGVSRPTLYRQFASKEALFEAFGFYEQARYDAGIRAATEHLEGAARLDAVLRFIVEFQHAYSLRNMVHVEPEHVLHQMVRVLPIMRDRLRPHFPGPRGSTVATVVTRVALSHFLLPDDDPNQFLNELRQAAGLTDTPRTRPRIGPATHARSRRKKGASK
jgi:AcrR family transcriptional regulator